MSLVATVERMERGAVVVTPVGELDAYTAPELRERLHEFAQDESVDVLVVDLGRVTFLDSSALGVLVGALRRMRERDRELRLVEPRPNVRRIFEITLLDRAFTFSPNAAAAVERGERA